MVDVAIAAGVSRQTLYNEFGTKEGLGAALVSRLIDGFLEGALRAAAEAAPETPDPAASCAGAAAWIMRSAREEPIVRSALTGCWGELMPPPVDAQGAHDGTEAVKAAQSGELAAVLCERLVAGMSPNGQSAKLMSACEAGLRVALSYVVAPSANLPDEEAADRVAEVVRALLARSR